MTDYIWLHGEKEPFGDVTIVSEGAREIVYTRGGTKKTVPSSDVRTLWHGEAPGELDHALRRMEKGEFKAAEALLEPLEKREGWVRTHAGFHRANARRLRAELEGTGHDEAIALLKAWREREGDHWLAPAAAIATGDAAVLAGQHDLAKTEYGRVAGYGDKLAARRGLARVALATSTDAAPVLAELEAIENDALETGGVDAILISRITRAAWMGKNGKAKEGLELLVPLVDTPAMVASTWHGAVLNTIVELIADLTGRMPDGSARPEARVAASYYANRAIRYASAQPVERARTLAFAVEANTLAGRHDIALMAKTELQRRFPTSTFAKMR